MGLPAWLSENIWVGVAFSLLMVLVVPFMWSAVEILRRGEEFIRIIWRNYAVLGVASVAYFLVGQHVMYGEPLIGFGATNSEYDVFGDYYTLEFALIDFLSQLGMLAICVVIASSVVWAMFGLASTLSFAALVSAFVYPVLGRAIWADSGWLSDLGFRDMAGGILCFGLAAGLALGLALGGVGRAKCAPERKKLDRPLWLLVLATIAVVFWCVPWWGGFGFSLGFVLVITFCTVVLPALAAVVVEFFFGKEIMLRTPVHGALASQAAAASGAMLMFTGEIWVALFASLSAALFVVVREAFESWSLEDPVDVVATLLPGSVLGSVLVGFDAEAPDPYFNMDLVTDGPMEPASMGAQLTGSSIGVGLGIVAGWAFSFFVGRAILQWRARPNKAPKEAPPVP